MIYEYGAMSSKFSLESENKLTAYASMVLHFANNPGMVAIYSPEESKKDSWLNFSGETEKLLNDLFGGTDTSFEDYVRANADEVKACHKTIKRLI